MEPSRRADPSLLPSSPLPLVSQDYYGLLRTERYRWWKGLLGIVLLLLGLFLASAVAAVIGIVIDVGQGEITLDQLTAEEISASRIPMGPALFIASNVGLAAMIPLSVLLNRMLFGQRGGWLSSVAGKFRWRWLLWCLLLVGVPWLAYYAVMLAVAPVDEGPVVLSGSVVVLLLLTLVTTPLQAAGEEWGFRAFIQRCLAAMVPDPRIGVGVAAILGSAMFMVLHVAADPWLNLFYFGLGLVFTALVWRTGGLEAAVTLHTVNNLSALVPVILTGQLGSSLDRSAGTGDWSVLAPLVLGAVLVVVVERLARRRGVARVLTPEVINRAAGGGNAPVASADAVGTTGVPSSALEDSADVEQRVTLEAYEHRDDTQPGAGDRRA